MCKYRTFSCNLVPVHIPVCMVKYSHTSCELICKGLTGLLTGSACLQITLILLFLFCSELNVMLKMGLGFRARLMIWVKRGGPKRFWLGQSLQ